MFGKVKELECATVHFDSASHARRRGEKFSSADFRPNTSFLIVLSADQD